MSDRAAAGNVEIVFVMLPVIAANRDDADAQLELTRKERERGERGEFLGRITSSSSVSRPKRLLHQSESRENQLTSGSPFREENRFPLI